MDIQEIYNIFKQYPNITTDSRNCPTDSLFFALKGEKFNGNTFAKETLKKGCKYAFVSEKEYADDKNIFYVGDTLKALQELATLHRATLNTPILGITGTNGKTTTKELTANVLKKKYNLLYTQGNLNNQIGVPLTLLQLKPEHQFAIIEMGASHPLDIKELVEIARPNFGLITNVGHAHIAGFGSFDNIVNTKCELYDFLKENDGIAFINSKNDILVGEAKKRALNYVPYNTDETIHVVHDELSPLFKFNWGETAIHTNLIGSYNLENVLAAITIGLHFGIAKEDAINAITSYEPTNNRSMLKRTLRNEIMVDAYNANPTSMNAALDNFIQLRRENKIVILGDMKELGVDSEMEHQKIADKLNDIHFKRIYLVGPNFKKTFCPQAEKFDNVSQLTEELKKESFSNSSIFLKGSNAMNLTAAIESL